MQADQVVGEQRPGPALSGRTADEVLAAALDYAAAQDISRSDRVLSTAEWDSDTALVNGLVSVFAAGASLVQVARPEPAAMERHRSTENVTRILR
jgi:hypothetical protein